MRTDTTPDISRKTFTITLTPDRNCHDPVKAIPRLLKLALRRCNLRCVDVREDREP